MHKSLDIDAAVEHVKNIFDNIRCAVCDNIGGTRMRYACGHTSCEDCVVVAPDCSVCLTPPQNAHDEPSGDKPYTERVENTVNLLNVFQNEFHVDVYKRQRISEQLKIEKELFPKCIQAPAKYFNKTKTYSNSKSNKSIRLSQLPGEELSPVRHHKMEQPSKNVELWLNKYVRKPFADLNSNDERLRQNSSAIKKQQKVMGTENAPITGSSRKRSHIKSALSVVKNQSLIDDHLTPVKKKKYNKKARIKSNLSVKSDTSKYLKAGTNINTTDNNESGIVMDDESVIVINDSQSTKVDKDMKAWLAVQEAENDKQYESETTSHSISKEVIPQLQDDMKVAIRVDELFTTKVPFYLKSCLSKQCIDCNRSKYNELATHLAGKNDDMSNDQIQEPTKDVSITVESKTFTAIINVKNIENVTNRVNSIQSVETQTDITNLMVDNKKNYIDVCDMKQDEKHVKQMSQIITCESPNQDIFRDDVSAEDIKGKNTVSKDNMNLKPLNRTHNIIIEESDSDGDLDASVSLEVTAEIHRSCEEIDYGILGDVDNLQQHGKRPRRAARGLTPTSTDSSEKENYDPNRQKKAPSSKKKPTKK